MVGGEGGGGGTGQKIYSAGSPSLSRYFAQQGERRRGGLTGTRQRHLAWVSGNIEADLHSEGGFLDCGGGGGGMLEFR